MEAIDNNAVIMAEDQLIAAIKSNDVAALDVLLHEDLLFATPTGQIVTKAADLESHRLKTMTVDHAETTVEDISLFGDTAVVSVFLRTSGSMLGQPVSGDFRYIRTWKMFGGEPKVIGGSCTQLL
jgi:hypothetical protein